MGSGNQMFDYREAAMELLKRSFPNIYYGTQVEPIFIPETFLPRTRMLSRAVDPKKFPEKNRQAYASYKEPKKKKMKTKYKMTKEEEEEKMISDFKGMFGERIFYDDLKAVLIMRNSKVVVLQDFQLMLPEILCKPGTQVGGRQESHFLIINQECQYLMSLEIIYKLYSNTAFDDDIIPSVQKGLDQITKIKTILETFFSNDIDISKWRFVGVLGYVEMSDHVRCCSDRKPFVVKSSELNDLFNKMEEDSQTSENNEDYKLMIRNLLYTIFANPGPIVRSKMDEATFEKIQKHQGNCTNILFWTPSQFDLVQLDENNKPKFKNLLFTSSFSTGKTEVMKGMMIKLLKAGEKVHYTLSPILDQK